MKNTFSGQKKVGINVCKLNSVCMLTLVSLLSHSASVFMVAMVRMFYRCLMGNGCDVDATG